MHHRGGWILCGYTDAVDGQTHGDAILIQLDSHLIFQKAVSIGSPYEDMLIDVQHDRHRGYYAAGWTKSPQGDYDGWLVRLDHALDTMWMVRTGGPGTDQLWSVLPTPNGCIAIGSTNSSLPARLSTIARMDPPATTPPKTTTKKP